MKKAIVVLLISIITIPVFAKVKHTTYKNVTIKICDEQMMGCANRLIIKNKDYLIDTVTKKANIKYLNVVSDLREQNKLETTLVDVKGYIKKEKGHFPNPTAEFEVFHISDLKVSEEK